MLTEKNRRISDAFESFKTILLTLLVSSLIILMFAYIGGTHIYQSMTQTEEKKNFDKLWSVQGTAGTDGLDQSRLLPEFIGYKLTGSSPAGSIADSDAASELYKLIIPCLLELFGSGSNCVRLEQNVGASLFGESAAGSEYIYIRYHEPVLYQMIYAYASDKFTIADDDVAVMTDSGNGAYVKEIIIIHDNNLLANRFIAYAYDGESNYFEFKQDASVVASGFYISKLTDNASSIDTLPFTFSEGGSLEKGQPLFEAELETEDITAEPAATLDSSIIQSLMRLFGYNPDKLNGSIDENGIGNYYDSNSRIWIETGAFTYIAFDSVSGIKLNSLLGYSVGDTLSFFDKLTAVDNLIRSLGNISLSLIGGEAALCLGEVYYEDGMLVFEYFHTFNNIRISGSPAVRAVLAQETLYSFELSAQSYMGVDSVSFSPNQSYVLRKLFETGVLHEDETGLVMKFAYRNGKAGWSVEYFPTESYEISMFN